MQNSAMQQIDIGLPSDELNDDNSDAGKKHGMPAKEQRSYQATFTQRNSLRGVGRQYRLFADQFLEVIDFKPRKKTKKVLNTIDLNLLYIADQTISERFIDWKLIIAGCITVLASIVAYYWVNIAIGVVTPIVCAGLLLVGSGILRSHHRLWFLSRYGQVPVLEIYNSFFKKKKLHKFLTILDRVIKKAHAQVPVDKSFLASEIEEHRRLRDSHYLDLERYEQAKKSIFSRFSDKL